MNKSNGETEEDNRVKIECAGHERLLPSFAILLQRLSSVSPFLLFLSAFLKQCHCAVGRSLSALSEQPIAFREQRGGSLN
jgi:hypothetical protein